jgi:hypothetical protein
MTIDSEQTAWWRTHVSARREGDSLGILSANQRRLRWFAPMPWLPAWLLLLALFSCRTLNQEEVTFAATPNLVPPSREQVAPLEKGIFWGSLDQDPIDFHELRSWGLTDFYLTNKYIAPDAVEQVALEVKKAGMRFHYWFEQGIQQGLVFVGTYDAPESLWLRTVPYGHPEYLRSPLCREVQFGKGFLDVENPAARAFFINSLVTAAQLPSISSVTLDDHTGYFMGPDGRNLPCLAVERRAALQAALTSLVNEAQRTLQQKVPGVRLILAHNPAAWALRTALADWTKWNIPVKNVQAYVSANVTKETQIAKSQGSTSMTLFSANADIYENILKVLQQNMGVILWKLPAPSLKEPIATLFRGLDTLPEHLATRADPWRCPERLQYAGMNAALATCSAPNQAASVPVEITQCLITSCEALGGGAACRQQTLWNRGFFCESLAPQHFARTSEEWQALLRQYRQLKLP